MNWRHPISVILLYLQLPCKWWGNRMHLGICLLVSSWTCTKLSPLSEFSFPSVGIKLLWKDNRDALIIKYFHAKGNENYNSRLNNAFFGLSCLYLEDESHMCARAMNQSPIKLSILWGLRLGVTHFSQTVMLFWSM